jgi:hypothetical protein
MPEIKPPGSRKRENLLVWSWRQLLIMYYFTKSDIKTTIIPVVIVY